MPEWLGRWLRIYEEEIALFLWSTLLLFLIRSASIQFNNFAETAFLKRFGVEYLPLVYMANSISTFFIMGLITGIMARIPGSRMLSYLFLFCGGSVAALRFVIPLGYELVYPLLFLLKSQYEVLLALIFWNLANDLFNTRQSKRLFPLITAGGVLGGILGSFATPLLAGWLRMDNLMLTYFGITLVGAVAVRRMGTRFPALLMTRKKAAPGRRRSGMIGEFKKIMPLFKESRLVRILVMLTLFPNVVIPIINYQFNFAIDQSFATEGRMIGFFAVFNGSLNVVSLVILLFVGRIYGRWGLPVALMFHPFNYMLAFAAFLLRFDLFSAMYARISTNVLRNTINNPARNVLMGLFPESYRAAIRPFLRGTVVRIGVLAGAGFIMVAERLVHPRFLSVVAFFFVGAWIFSTFSLKRNYSRILLDLISRNMLDLRSLEEKDLGQVFGERRIQERLLENLLAAKGEDSLWYARLLRSLGVEALDRHLPEVIRRQDDRTRLELIPMLSAKAADETVTLAAELASPDKPALTMALLRALHRTGGDAGAELQRAIFETHPDPMVQAHAVMGLYRADPDRYRGILDTWLASSNPGERQAGIVAAGGSGDSRYCERLIRMLDGEADGAQIAGILESLRNLEATGLNALAHGFLEHPEEGVRMAALRALEVRSDEDLRRLIPMLGDPSDRVVALVKSKIEGASHQNPLLLVESLIIRRRRVREEIYELLASMNIRDLDIFRFARSQLERSYGHLAEAQALTRLTDTAARDLLKDHLTQSSTALVENVLRVLAVQDRTGQVRLVWRGIFSADPRQRSNSVEALEDLVDPSLARIMVPLLEDQPLERRLSAGRKHFQLPRFSTGPGPVLSHLLESADNWVTAVLALDLAARLDALPPPASLPEAVRAHGHREVHRMLARLQGSIAEPREDKEHAMEPEISIPEKILHLRNIQIFEGLSVGELAAIASVTEEVSYPQGEVVIRQGDPGDTMYLIVSGEVAVCKRLDEGVREIELDRIGGGDYFGEMALFGDNVRTATIRTSRESRFLVLHKREFTEIVREYPEIALHICRVLSARLLKLHEKVKAAGAQ